MIETQTDEELVAKAVELAYPLFVFHGWRYFNSKGDVASRSEVTDMETGLVARMRSENIMAVACGRFKVERDADIPNGLNVSLELAYN